MTPEQEVLRAHNWITNRKGKDYASSSKEIENVIVHLKYFTYEVGDIVWYEPFPGAEKEKGVVSSLCDDEDYIFVRFKAINGERTHKSNLSR